MKAPVSSASSAVRKSAPAATSSVRVLHGDQARGRLRRALTPSIGSLSAASVGDHSSSGRISGLWRRATATMAMAMVALLALAAPAHAAAYYGGAGTPFTITVYNSLRTGYLPVAPSSVPSTSTITDIIYRIFYTAPSSASGSFLGQLCTANLADCTNVAPNFTGTTNYFNGLPAQTQFVFRVEWFSFASGTIPGGGVKVTDEIYVDYT